MREQLLERHGRCLQQGVRVDAESIQGRCRTEVRCGTGADPARRCSCPGNGNHGAARTIRTRSFGNPRWEAACTSFSLPPIPLSNVQPTPALPSCTRCFAGSSFLSGVPTSPRPSAAWRRPMEQIGIAQAAYYPTLNLAAVAGLEGSSLVEWVQLAQPLLGCGTRHVGNAFRRGEAPGHNGIGKSGIMTPLLPTIAKPY